jgi:protein-S-isoprenylcysteine O-methyltransferase Ste14
MCNPKSQDKENNMNAHNTASKILLPGYGLIVAGSVVENLALRESWFLLGSIFGLLWLAVGLVFLLLAQRELKKGEGFMLVQSGPYAWSRNPVMAANLLGVMPGLCLLLSTNLGIAGIVLAGFLFFKRVGDEELELEDRFGEAYLAYRERVGRLLSCPSSGEN